jgi:acetylornithine deacetylase/succinyl-diaminopimelate desuccinylase-like protein
MQTKHIIVALAFLFAVDAATAQQTTPRQAVDRFVAENGSQILAEYAELLAIPNVGSDSAGIHRNADFIGSAFQRRGVMLEQLKVPGAPPLIYGEIETPGATRTLGIYIHYDGQPVDESRWTHGPWQPTLYTRSMELGGEPRPMPVRGEAIDPEWYLYARSAGDDKAPFGALLPVLDAFRESEIALTSNIKFMLDGEEEMGSPNLQQYLDEYGDRWADVDVWLFCDGPMHHSRRGQLRFGVRGITGLEVTVYGATRSLHSGHYGNWAPVPGFMLAELLASMKDEDGRVLVEGFYDTVEEIGEVEREALSKLAFYDDALRSELGLARTDGGGESLAERMMLPSLTVRGLASGNVGSKSRNILPSTATATLGMRLVKGNEPAAMLDLVEAHIRKLGFHIVREDPDHATRLAHAKIAKVIRHDGYPASRTPMDLPIAQDIIAAMTRAGGEPPILVPTSGGSVRLFLFEHVLGQPSVILPIANHDDNQHAANENLRMANLIYGMSLYAEVLTMP